MRKTAEFSVSDMGDPLNLTCLKLYKSITDTPFGLDPNLASQNALLKKLLAKSNAQAAAAASAAISGQSTPQSTDQSEVSI